jgi:ATP-binding cassette subfamily A (ABC1) protein 3
MLQEHKKDRIVLITTHYMDEADILGDRIGIMVNGKLKCLGSSMFLKNKIGVGYNLTIIKSNSETNSKVLPFVTNILGPEVMQVSEIQTELTINIPSIYAEHFANFFTQFENA